MENLPADFVTKHHGYIPHPGNGVLEDPVTDGLTRAHGAPRGWARKGRRNHCVCVFYDLEGLLKVGFLFIQVTSATAAFHA